jgi:hypothetical protein
MMRDAVVRSLVLGLLFSHAAWAEAPLLYLPFDGDARPAVSAGPAPLVGGALLDYRDGMRGQAVRLDADCRLTAPSGFRVEAGTIACWLRPLASLAERGSRYIFCRYGDGKLKPGWAANRLNLLMSGRTLSLSIFPSSGARATTVEAPLGDWPAGKWRHVAASWKNVNSGRADAELCLFVDGRLAARRAGVRLDVGPMSDLLDIGRDSDGSPDYAQADCDEFYLYGRALAEAEIRRAVAEVKTVDRITAAAPAAAGRSRSDWWNDAWPLRCRVSATWEGTARPTIRLPLDLASDTTALGVHGRIEPESLRVLPCDAKTGRLLPGAGPLPAVVEADSLLWLPSPAQVASGRVAAEMYFDVARLNTDVPLLARAESRVRPAAPQANFSVPDYASDTYGDAWDFDEGDFEGIDGYGNRDYGIGKKEVREGRLCLDVCDDPYIIWGDLWNSGRATNRPVAIDLAQYPVLTMKVRQDCARAEWRVMGRTAKSTSLMAYAFTVTGTGWQVVRVDLAREARFGGTLVALRIDPTEEIAKAHVEFDWIRLVRETEARREPVETLGASSTAPTSLAVCIARRSAPCGSRQPVVVCAADAGGKPIAGLPVTVRLAERSGGQLTASSGQRSLALGVQARRGLTDAQGRLAVELESSVRAGEKADVVEAQADFTALRSAGVAVAALAGAPHHYQVDPVRGAIVPSSRFPMPVSVQVADEHDNPLPLAGREVLLSTGDGGSLNPARLVTDAQGRAGATLAVDAARRWVYTIEDRDGQGIAGRSGAISVALDSPRPKHIRLLPNGYFAWSDGRPFVPLGGFYANWVQRETPDGEWADLRSFTDTSDAEKVRWMEFLHQSGVTAMRMMLRTHRTGGMEPMDVCGRVNRPLLAESLRYMDLARRFGLQFQLVVHEDYSKPVYFNAKAFELYAAQAFAGEDLDRLPAEQRRFVRDHKWIAPIGAKYTDPDVLACQDRYVAELLPALRGNPQVMAYELENEMVDCPASWASHAVGTLRGLDPHTLVCASHGGGGLHTADPAWWHNNTPIDFYNYHLYPHGTTTPELDYGAATAVLIHYGRMCGPNLLGESSGDQFRLHPSRDTRRWVMRDLIWMSLAGGSPGVFFWNARGAEVGEFRFAREALESLDLTTFRRARPEIGIDVRHPMTDDKWYRTPEGQRAFATMGRYAQHYLSEGVDFDFTLRPEDYRLHCALDRFAPPTPGKRTFRVGPGWQLASLARDDGRALLVYVRNYAGAELWECQMERHPWRQYLRRRQAAPLRVELQSGDGPYRLTLYDLDQAAKSTRTLAPGQPLDLGTTDHDFVLVLHRATP